VLFISFLWFFFKIKEFVGKSACKRNLTKTIFVHFSLNLATPSARVKEAGFSKIQYYVLCFVSAYRMAYAWHNRRGER
jgi:hypothetical protein